VSQQPAYPVFCFEGQKVPYPASSFLSDMKLCWGKSHYYQPEVGPDPEYRSRLRQDSAFFFRTRSQIFEKKTGLDPELLFNFGSSRSLCGHFVSENMGKLRLDWWL